MDPAPVEQVSLRGCKHASQLQHCHVLPVGVSSLHAGPACLIIHCDVYRMITRRQGRCHSSTSHRLVGQPWVWGFEWTRLIACQTGHSLCKHTCLATPARIGYEPTDETCLHVLLVNEEP